MWYVEVDGKRVSKYYPFKIQAVIHAFEKRMVWHSSYVDNYLTCKIIYTDDCGE